MKTPTEAAVYGSACSVLHEKLGELSVDRKRRVVFDEVHRRDPRPSIRRFPNLMRASLSKRSPTVSHVNFGEYYLIEPFLADWAGE